MRAAKASASHAAVEAAEGRLLALREALVRGGVIGFGQKRFERVGLVFLKRDFQLQRRQRLVQLLLGLGRLNCAFHSMSSSFSNWHRCLRARVR